MNGNWIENRAEADEFLKTHSSVRLTMRRVRAGWIAEIEETHVQPLPHLPMRLASLRSTLANRYLANVYDREAHVNLLWASRMPNWPGDLGALPELAAAIIKAEACGQGVCA